MWLSALVKQRAGALSSAAERFVAEHWTVDSPAYSGGRDGLVALCTQLERFAHEPHVDEEGERRFVEGAGALLGVLLIEHVPGASYASERGVHRVRLGAHGFFDPFAAVDRALDAGNIRRELAREVARAEDEAAARGPLSRVAAALCQAIEAERPDLALQGQFDCTLRVTQRASGEPIEIDLKRAVETTLDQDQRAVEKVARRLLSLLPGALSSQPQSADELSQRLLPRLARHDALHDLTSQGKSLLFAQPFSDELSIALLAEFDGRARYVRIGELTELGFTPAQALTQALDNLRARSESARIVREPAELGTMFVARTGDGRDSARVLLPELHAELTDRIGPSVCLALPHRDTFFACSAACEPSRRRLAARAAEDSARAPHALSARVFMLQGGELRALES
jgi:uncharacterized protein YtpQ (UPF0354 family)